MQRELSKVTKYLLANGFEETGAGGDREHAIGPAFTSYRGTALCTSAYTGKQKRIEYSIFVYDRFFVVLDSNETKHCFAGETEEDLLNFFTHGEF